MSVFEPTRTRHLSALSRRLQQMGSTMNHLHALLRPQLKTLENSFSKGEDSSALRQPNNALSDGNELFSADDIMSFFQSTARSAVGGIVSETFGSSKLGEGQRYADLATAISKAMKRNL